MNVAEKELARMIERRADRNPDPDEIEESWKASVRPHHARLREADRWAWIRYFDRVAASHAAISEHYTAKAEALIEGEGRG